MFHEQQQTISMRSDVREWPNVLLVNTPAQLLRNWGEQRPSNNGDFDSSVTGEAGTACYIRVDLLLM
jgi:hypothetical protein